MIEIICVGRSLRSAASLFPSINLSRLDTAPMRHSLGPSRTRSSGGGRTGMPVRSRSTMREADRSRSSLRLPRRPKNAPTITEVFVNRLRHYPCQCLCLRQKTIRLRRTCGLHSLPGARSCRPSTSHSSTKTSSHISPRLSTGESSLLVSPSRARTHKSRLSQSALGFEPESSRLCASSSKHDPLDFLLASVLVLRPEGPRPRSSPRSSSVVLLPSQRLRKASSRSSLPPKPCSGTRTKSPPVKVLRGVRIR